MCVSLRGSKGIIMGNVVEIDMYRKVSNIKCTKFPNLNVSRFVMQLSLPNVMKPGVKSRMKM